MPRETVVVVTILGPGMGILWGALSLAVWAADPRTPGVVIAPLWLVAVIGPHVNVNVNLLGAVICATLGLVAASVFLIIARARGA